MKKVVIIVIVLLLIISSAIGGYFFFVKKSDNVENTESNDASNDVENDASNDVENDASNDVENNTPEVDNSPIPEVMRNATNLKISVTNKVLNFAELEVYQGDTKLTLTSPHLTNEKYGLKASYAVDGVTDGDYERNKTSILHSPEETESDTFTATLPPNIKMIDITKVKIYNRLDGWQYRTIGAEIKIFNDDHIFDLPKLPISIEFQKFLMIDLTSKPLIWTNANKKVNIIVVSRGGTVLSIAEIEAYRNDQKLALTNAEQSTLFNDDFLAKFAHDNDPKTASHTVGQQGWFSIELPQGTKLDDVTKVLITNRDSMDITNRLSNARVLLYDFSTNEFKKLGETSGDWTNVLKKEFNTSNSEWKTV